MELKERVRRHWEEEPCGLRFGRSEDPRAFFREVEAKRYELEPFLPNFADFGGWRGRRVLEIGVGIGTDFKRWVQGGAKATGMDLTLSGILTARRDLRTSGLDRAAGHLAVADAEEICFRSQTFDLIYAWGVLHHTPKTEVALAEAWRVLKVGGRLKMMVYHVPSWTGWLLWIVHGLCKGRPFLSPRRVLFDHLESPGTKAYTRAEIQRLVRSVGFEEISTQVELGPSDLLTMDFGPRYQRAFFRFLVKIYPRFLVRALGSRFGLTLMVEARKGSV